MYTLQRWEGRNVEGRGKDDALWRGQWVKLNGLIEGGRNKRRGGGKALNTPSGVLSFVTSSKLFYPDISRTYFVNGLHVCFSDLILLSTFLLHVALGQPIFQSHRCFNDININRKKCFSDGEGGTKIEKEGREEMKLKFLLV